MNYDLSSFNVREIPITEAKQDIINASKSPIDQSYAIITMLYLKVRFVQMR